MVGFVTRFACCVFQRRLFIGAFTISTCVYNNTDSEYAVYGFSIKCIKKQENSSHNSSPQQKRSSGIWNERKL